MNVWLLLLLIGVIFIGLAFLLEGEREKRKQERRRREDDKGRTRF